MRILYSSASAIFSDHRAGGEIQISYDVVSAAALMGHQVTVLAPVVDLMRDLPNCTTCAVGGYDLIKERDYFKGRLDWWKYAVRCRFKCESLLKTGGFDIVHHILPSDKGKFSLCSRQGRPFIYGPVFSPWEEMPPEEYGEYALRGSGPIRALKNKAADRLNMTLGARLWRRTLREASAILVELERTRAFIPEEFRGKVRVFSPGVDLGLFVPAPEPQGRPTVLFTALLARRKGLEYLIKSMVEVIGRSPGVQLLIAGDGPDKKLFEEMVREVGLGDHVRFLGEVSYTEVPSLLKRAHIFCLPSIGEPYGMSALQAMACARPVVATNAGGLARLIDDSQTGLLVPTRDSKSIAQAISRLISDRELRLRLGAAARRKVEADYSFQAMSERLGAIYKEALDRS